MPPALARILTVWLWLLLLLFVGALVGGFVVGLSSG